MVQVYTPAAARNLPLTAIGTDGFEIEVNDAALLSQIHIIGDKMAELAGMHGQFLEQALDADKIIVAVVDHPRYFGIVRPNPAGGINAKGYDKVVTLGKGVKGAEILPTDGDLIAQLVIQDRYSVIPNIQGMGVNGASTFVYGLTDTLAGMRRAKEGMLFGFSSLSGTQPRRRMGKDGVAVAANNSLADRAYELNIGVVNVMSGAQEVPVEFDRKAKNTIAMLSVGESQQEDLAQRVGKRFRSALLSNVNNSFGLARSAIAYGTYFNPGDLDNVNGPYIVTVKELRSDLGEEVDEVKANAVTKAFMIKLKALRAKKAKALKKATRGKLLDRALQSEELRTIKLGLRNGGTATQSKVDDHIVETAVRKRRAIDFTLVRTDGHEQALAGRPYQMMAAVVMASTKEGARQIRQNLQVDAGSVAAIIDGEDVTAFARRIDALRKRAGCSRSRGLATAMHILERHDAGAAAAFFATINRLTPEGTTAGRLIAALRDESLTPHRIVDYALQAFVAHRDGTALEGFVRNVHFMPLGEEVRTVKPTATAANDDRVELARAA